MKALIVDPDVNRTPALKMALSAAGATVTIASGGSFALTMLEWNRHDVVVSRARIDDMEGHELCAILKSDPGTRDVRFVLLASPSEISSAQTTAAGVDLVVSPVLAAADVAPMVVRLVNGEPPVSVPPPAPARPPVVAAPPRPAAVKPTPVATPAPPVVKPLPPVTPASSPAPKPAIAPSVVPAVPKPASAAAAPVAAAPPARIPPVAVPAPTPTMAPPVPAAPPAAADGALPIMAPADAAATPARAEPTGLPKLAPPPAAPVPEPPKRYVTAAAAAAAAPWTPSAPAPARPAAPPSPSVVPADMAVPSGTFQGTLEVMDLAELTQAIALGGKTGRLILALPQGSGLIVFEAGRVVHAEYRGGVGEAAFAALLSAAHRNPAGRFCFLPSGPGEAPSPTHTIDKSVDRLLLSVATAIDEKG